MKLLGSSPCSTGHPELPQSLQRQKHSFGSSIVSLSTILSRAQLRKGILIQDVRRKRERYEDFLKSVSLFSNMDSYERTKLAEAFREHEFSQGQCVIREGEPGDCFYIVLEGEAVATKVL